MFKPKYLSLIIIIFILSVLFVSPLGEFLLYDDWNHGLSLKWFIEDSELRLSNYTTTSFIGQVFWGAPFAYIMGFSFDTLKIISIITSLICLILFYFLLQELKVNKFKSFLATLLLFFNPVYFIFSFIFMSDIPFTTLLIASTLCYVKSVNKNSDLYLIIGTILASYSILIRQNGIMIPIAMFMYLLVTRKLNLKKILIITIIPGIFVTGFYYWLYFIHGPTLRYIYSSARLKLIHLIPPRIIVYSFVSVMILGLYSIPFTLYYLIKTKLKKKEYLLIILFFLLMAAGHYLFFYFFGSSSFEYQLTMRGMGTHDNSDFLYFPKIIWNILTFFVILSASLLLFIPIKNIKKILFQNKLSKPINIVYFIAFFQFIWLIIIPGLYDKYLIPLFPALIILLIKKTKWSNLKNILVIAIVLSAAFSLIAYRDTMNYQRTKWTALNELTKSGISPKEIDGGFMFNGYYLSEYIMNISEDKVDPVGKSGKLWVEDDKYVVATYVPENYSILKEYESTQYLGLKKLKIYTSIRD